VSRVGLRALAIAALVELPIVSMIGNCAYAQTPEVDSINLGARAGLTPAAPVIAPGQDRPAGPVEFSAGAAFASDYIYRGVTLSDRKPAIGAALEAMLGPLYAGTTFTSVKLPSEPAGEITANAGLRPKLWNIDWDFGWTYFAYPGEIPGSPGINYWEVGTRADTKLTESLRVAAGFAYSPNFSNTGGWSKYAAFGLGVDPPRSALPQDVTASITGGTGYYWFGNQSAALGGFPLPAYLNWNAGVTLTRKIFNLDLRYYDTNLSREDCFVFTGDPHGTPGGQINPLSNPEGLTVALVQRHIRREVLVRTERRREVKPCLQGQRPYHQGATPQKKMEMLFISSQRAQQISCSHVAAQTRASFVTALNSAF
jgi:uncharacterized protein (TIGR02001 family)